MLKKILLILILLLGIVVRLYRVDNPVAAWHSWRQADTASVPRNFYQEGYNPFYPKGDDMSAISDSGEMNPERYRFVEFPIYGSLVYFAYLINGGVDERYARIINILFATGSTLFIYFIAKKYFDTFIATLSMFLFAVLPFNVFFSRTILPEPSLVFFCLGMFYFVDRWIWEDKLSLYFVSLFFTICAFLTKPMAVFYLLPLIYVYYQKEGRLFPIPNRYFKLFVPALLPLLFWRVWMGKYPEGIPSSNWLYNSDGIRFRPAFWRWIIGDRLGREILSVCGTVLLMIGVLVRPTAKSGLVLHLLFLSFLLYLAIFATGNVTHDYYQVLIVPALVIFVARGFVVLIRGSREFIPRIWTIPTAVLFLVLTIYLSWFEVKGLYQINNPVIVEAGRYADKILPKNARVVAPYNGDTAFLYQINRHGWPIIATSIDDLVFKKGATAYVSVNKDTQTKEIMVQFTPIFENDKFVIVDLTRQNPNYKAK